MSDVEEAAAEAFATAVERWRADGVPPNPADTTLANPGVRGPIDRPSREEPRPGPGMVTAQSDIRTV